VLTCVELSGLILIIFIGLWALGGGEGTFSQVIHFEAPQGQGLFGAVTAATGLAFFAMVGFEDLVNMAEECPGLDHGGRTGAAGPSALRHEPGKGAA
jgi:basic amino acid/polyamine antiporter, APA family